MSSRVRTLVFLSVLAMVAPAVHGGTQISTVAEGSVVYVPDSGALAEQTTFIIADCFQTTATNLTMRRGFLEFPVPNFRGKIREATLVFTLGNRTTTQVELSYYPADLDVSVEDYDRPTTPIATIQTTATSTGGSASLSFNVTSAVRDLEGKAIGFRLKLVDDPRGSCFTSEYVIMEASWTPVAPKLLVRKGG